MLPLGLYTSKLTVFIIFILKHFLDCDHDSLLILPGHYDGSSVYQA